MTRYSVLGFAALSANLRFSLVGECAVGWAERSEAQHSCFTRRILTPIFACVWPNQQAIYPDGYIGESMNTANQPVRPRARVSPD